MKIYNSDISFRLLAFGVMLGLALLTLWGCGKDNATIAATGIALDKTILSITTGGTAALTATVSPANATNKSVTWSSSDTTIAKVDTKGVVTAVKAGSAGITVSTVDGNKISKATVTVTDVAPAVVTVTITSATGTIISTDLVLIATVQPAEANQAVTWAVTDAGTTGATIADGTNVLKATAAGTVKVTATSVADPTISATQSIAVTTRAEKVNITSTGPATADTAYVLTATVVPNTASQDVVWSVFAAGNTGATIAAGTNVLNTNAAGTVTVKATSDTDHTIFATQSISVNAKAEKVNITSASTATVGTAHTLTSAVVPDTASQDVVWSVAAAGTTGATIAEGTNVLKTTAAGRVTVKAMSVTDHTIFATQSISVNAKAEKVNITSVGPANAGTPYKLISTVVPDTASQEVAWSISITGNTGATIEEGTNVLNTTATGTVTVKATSVADPAISATQRIVVNSATVAVMKVTLNKNTTTITAGQKEGLVATVEPSDASDPSLTWRTSDDTIAKVNPEGLVEAVGVGEATITVTTTDGDKEDSCVVTVSPTQASTAP